MIFMCSESELTKAYANSSSTTMSNLHLSSQTNKVTMGNISESVSTGTGF